MGELYVAACRPDYQHSTQRNHNYLVIGPWLNCQKNSGKLKRFRRGSENLWRWKLTFGDTPYRKHAKTNLCSSKIRALPNYDCIWKK